MSASRRSAGALPLEQGRDVLRAGAGIPRGERRKPLIPPPHTGGGTCGRGASRPLRAVPQCCTYVAGACGTDWDRTGRDGARRDTDS